MVIDTVTAMVTNKVMQADRADNLVRRKFNRMTRSRNMSVFDLKQPDLLGELI